MLPTPEAVALPAALVVALLTGCAYLFGAVANYLAKRQETRAQARMTDEQTVWNESGKLREALQSETRRLTERIDAIERLHAERGLRIDSLVERVRHLETMNEELLRLLRENGINPPPQRPGQPRLMAIPRDAGGA